MPRKFFLQPRVSKIQYKTGRAFRVLDGAMHTGQVMRWNPNVGRDMPIKVTNEKRITYMKQARGYLTEALIALEKEIERCEDLLRERANAA